MTRKKGFATVGTALLLGGGGVAFSRIRNAGPKLTEPSPFRIGKAQQSNLQVSVREVGMVDPVTKVDVKSPVSGRVVALNVREGAKVKVGDVLAEVEPDVNQAQSLSDVHTSVTQGELRLKEAEREYAVQSAIYQRELGARATMREHPTRRDIV